MDYVETTIMKRKIDVLGIEKRLNLNSQQFADFLGIDISDVKTFEQNSVLDLDAIDTLIRKTDLKYEDIMSSNSQQKIVFHANDSWKKAGTLKANLLSYISYQLDGMNIPASISYRYVEGLMQGINMIMRKPKMVLVGRSDTGKSTLINSLLQSELMPAFWTPATSIAVYIKHKNDRPRFIQEDVWVFLDHVGDEKGWDVDRLGEETYCKEWMMEKGNLDLLNEFGTRRGKNWLDRIVNHSNTQGPTAGAAVVFVNAPILKDVDIIDLPGYGTEVEQDTKITFKTAGQADILVYLSQANGFMRIEDINYLKQNIRQLPVFEKQGETEIAPLANLFIVASQAHTVNHGNPNELEKILKSGAFRLADTISRNYWDSRKELSGYKDLNYSKVVLPGRFFTYTTDIPDLCSKFIEQLEIIIHQLPKYLDHQVKEFVTQYIEAKRVDLEKEIQTFEDAILEREKYEQLLQDLKDSEWERKEHNNREKDRIIGLIQNYKSECRESFSSYYAKIMNVKRIISNMKSMEVKNKKEQVVLYASRLQDQLSSTCEELIKQKVKVLKKEIDKFTDSFNDDINTPFEKAAIDVSFDPNEVLFSAFGAIGGVLGAGMAVAGFSSITVGMFSTVGVSSIFGPIGIGVGITAVAILGIRHIAGGWQKYVAEDIIKKFEDNNVREKYEDGFDLYWEGVEARFINAYLELDKRYDEYLENLKEHATDSDPETQRNNIIILKSILKMYNGFAEDLLS